MEIRHSEWLQLETETTKLYGYSQKWYKTSFQQTRGCGPTAAAMLLTYLNRREAQPLPYKDTGISELTEAMESIWAFITPGWLLGLNSTREFCAGITELFAYYRLNWQCRRLSIPIFKQKRPALAEMVKFIENGLTADCPVAFLNLHRGTVSSIETWHWIVLVSLHYDAGRQGYMATCYDGGRSLSFDLGQWLATTKLGGGFVYITIG